MAGVARGSAHHHAMFPFSMPGGRLAQMRVVYAAIGMLWVLAGCDPRPDEVPDSVPPGSIDSVTREVAAGGGSGRAAPGIDDVGVVPFQPPRPVIPLITPPHVILFYCFPRVSRDGLAWRNGVWIARVITPFSWGVDDALHDDALRLSSLNSLHLDDQGQLVIDRAAYRASAADPGAGDAAADHAASLSGPMPWRPTADQPTTRTTVIYPSSGTAVTSSASGASPYLQANGSVNLQEVQKAMAAAQERLRASQLQHAASTTAAPTPPVPGEALGAGAAVSPGVGDDAASTTPPTDP